MNQFVSRYKSALILIIVLTIGLIFRCGIGLYWDQGQQLHPDERFLSMVLGVIHSPNGIKQYFDTATSPFSPHNNGHEYYVYGTFPLFLTRIIGEIFKIQDYGLNLSVGRVLASLADILTILVTYLLASRLYSKKVALASAVFLAFSVQNIQLSHFFGMENFVGLFVVLSAYVLVSSMNTFRKGLIAGFALGTGLACKISAIFFAPIAGLYFIFRNTRRPHMALLGGILFGVGCYAGFRIFQPYAFESFSWFSLTSTFLENMRKIKELTDGGEWPPNVQWAGRTPVIFTLSQMFKWEMGPFWAVPAFVGTVVAFVELLKRRNTNHFVPVLWTLFFLLYQSTRFVTYGRYLSIIYPFLAILAAYATVEIFPRYSKALTVICCTGTFLWAAAFTNIYSVDHTRVRASRWMFDNIPQGAVIANESWDDGLPLRVDGKDGYGGIYTEVSFNHYEIDSPTKLQDLLTKLEKADYISISSNRAYATVPRLLKRYPFTSYYFKMLFSGELGFDRVHTEATYPNLFGININTDRAVESFTVYDHPKVIIFKKGKDFNIKYVRERLSNFPPGEFEPVTKIKTVETPWVYSLLQ